MCKKVDFDCLFCNASFDIFEDLWFFLQKACKRMQCLDLFMFSSDHDDHRGDYFTDHTSCKIPW